MKTRMWQGRKRMTIRTPDDREARKPKKWRLRRKREINDTLLERTEKKAREFLTSLERKER